MAQRILGAIEFRELREEERHAPTPARPANGQKRKWRTELPSPQERKRLRAVKQNTPEWHFERSQGGWGASESPTVVGWDEKSTNDWLFQKDSGLVPVEETDPETQKVCFDYGHVKENEAARLIAIISGADVSTTGIHVHPSVPYFQVSPDRLLHYPNPTRFRLPRFGILEIKSLIFDTFLSRIEDDAFEPNVKPMHMIQMQNQCACAVDEENWEATAQWVEYAAYWCCNQKSGLTPVWDERMDMIDWRVRPKPSVWAAVDLVHVWIKHNRAISNGTMAFLTKHKNAVETGMAPTRLPAFKVMADVPIAMRPLARLNVLLHGCSPTIDPETHPFEAIAHAKLASQDRAAFDIQYPRPPADSGYIGEWPPRLSVHLKNYGQTSGETMFTLKQLKERSMKQYVKKKQQTSSSSSSSSSSSTPATTTSTAGAPIQAPPAPSSLPIPRHPPPPTKPKLQPKFNPKLTPKPKAKAQAKAKAKATQCAAQRYKPPPGILDIQQMFAKQTEVAALS